MIYSNEDSIKSVQASILSQSEILTANLSDIEAKIEVIATKLDTLNQTFIEYKGRYTELKDETIAEAEELKASAAESGDTDIEALIDSIISDIETSSAEIENINIDSLCTVEYIVCTVNDGSENCIDYCAVDNNNNSSDNGGGSNDNTGCGAAQGVCPSSWCDASQSGDCAQIFTDCGLLYWNHGGEFDSCIDDHDIEIPIEYCGQLVSDEYKDSTFCPSSYNGRTIDCENKYQRTNGNTTCSLFYRNDNENVTNCDKYSSTENQKNCSIDYEGSEGKCWKFSVDNYTGITTCFNTFRTPEGSCMVNYIENNGVPFCQEDFNDANPETDCGAYYGIVDIQNDEGTEEITVKSCKTNYTEGDVNCTSGFYTWVNPVTGDTVRTCLPGDEACNVCVRTCDGPCVGCVGCDGGCQSEQCGSEHSPPCSDTPCGQSEPCGESIPPCGESPDCPNYTPVPACSSCDGTNNTADNCQFPFMMCSGHY